jgi:hypothetical protein
MAHGLNRLCGERRGLAGRFLVRAGDGKGAKGADPAKGPDPAKGADPARPPRGPARDETG